MSNETIRRIVILILWLAISILWMTAGVFLLLTLLGGCAPIDPNDPGWLTITPMVAQLQTAQELQ